MSLSSFLIAIVPLMAEEMGRLAHIAISCFTLLSVERRWIILSRKLHTIVMVWGESLLRVSIELLSGGCAKLAV